jgi:hypothetical protein
MGSKTEHVMVMDCNTIANGIMRDITDIDAMERMLSSELSSEDLFRIDSAILSSLRNTTDFSRDLLKQLEEGRFETVTVKPQKSLDSELAEIQLETMADITLPLQRMFDEMVNCVSEVLI